jgi:hypothetical protein
LAKSPTEKGVIILWHSIDSTKECAGLIVTHDLEFSFIVAPFLRKQFIPIYEKLFKGQEITRTIKFGILVSGFPDNNTPVLSPELIIEFPWGYKITCLLPSHNIDILARTFQAKQPFIATIDKDTILHVLSGAKLDKKTEEVFNHNLFNIKDGLEEALLNFLSYLRFLKENIPYLINGLHYWA